MTRRRRFPEWPAGDSAAVSLLERPDAADVVPPSRIEALLESGERLLDESRRLLDELDGIASATPTRPPRGDRR